MFQRDFQCCEKVESKTQLGEGDQGRWSWTKTQLWSGLWRKHPISSRLGSSVLFGGGCSAKERVKLVPRETSLPYSPSLIPTASKRLKKKKKDLRMDKNQKEELCERVPRRRWIVRIVRIVGAVGCRGGIGLLLLCIPKSTAKSRDFFLSHGSASQGVAMPFSLSLLSGEPFSTHIWKFERISCLGFGIRNLSLTSGSTTHYLGEWHWVTSSSAHGVMVVTTPYCRGAVGKLVNPESFT